MAEERIRQLSETPLETYVRHLMEEQERLRKEEEERYAESARLLLGALASRAELIRAQNEEKLRQKEAALEAARVYFATLTEEQQFAYIDAKTALDELDQLSVGLEPDSSRFIELMEKAYAIYKRVDEYLGPIMAVASLLSDPTPMGLLTFISDTMNFAVSGDTEPPDVIGAFIAIFKSWREKRREG